MKFQLSILKNFIENIPDVIKRITYINSLQYASNVDQKEYIKECTKYTNILEKNLN